MTKERTSTMTIIAISISSELDFGSWFCGFDMLAYDAGTGSAKAAGPNRVSAPLITSRRYRAARWGVDEWYLVTPHQKFPQPSILWRRIHDPIATLKQPSQTRRDRSSIAVMPYCGARVLSQEVLICIGDRKSTSLNSSH